MNVVVDQSVPASSYLVKKMQKIKNSSRCRMLKLHFEMSYRDDKKRSQIKTGKLEHETLVELVFLRETKLKSTCKTSALQYMLLFKSGTCHVRFQM